MIAVAAAAPALLLLQPDPARLPPAQAALAMPPDWTREFTAGGTLDAARAGRRDGDHEKDPGRHQTHGRRRQRARGRRRTRASAKNGWAVPPIPCSSMQDTVNARADQFMRLCETFEVPMNQYLQAQQTWNQQDRKPGTSMYNPIGAILSRSRMGKYLRAATHCAPPAWKACAAPRCSPCSCMPRRRAGGRGRTGRELGPA